MKIEKENLITILANDSFTHDSPYFQNLSHFINEKKDEATLIFLDAPYNNTFFESLTKLNDSLERERRIILLGYSKKPLIDFPENIIVPNETPFITSSIINMLLLDQNTIDNALESYNKVKNINKKPVLALTNSYFYLKQFSDAYLVKGDNSLLKFIKNEAEIPVVISRTLDNNNSFFIKQDIELVENGKRNISLCLSPQAFDFEFSSENAYNVPGLKTKNDKTIKGNFLDVEIIKKFEQNLISAKHKTINDLSFEKEIISNYYL